MHVPIDSSTHYLAFQTVRLHCQNPTLMHACLCREAVCTIFLMVFGMTRPGSELTTYRARGGHATKPTRHGIPIIERFRFFNVYVYDKRCSERDTINGISGSGNPMIVRVSQDWSIHSDDSPVQLWHAYTQRWQTVTVYVICLDNSK